ncbi:MAG: T9SS type A sorting domain-containing protein [Bacteroidetes bacterium]|nr:T9SS type A sorting domain-containing protein [Bacteroidota bacterium]HET6244860.1 T9SS type A sorting domain-containing protein [Bacteroidia bacterium]
MKTAILIFLFLFNAMLLIAQNYQTVLSNRIGYFEDSNKDVRCIRIDSVLPQTDSIFFPAPNINFDGECFTPYGPSWLGSMVIVKNDGYNLYFNKDKDTVKIKTIASLNETWTAFQIQDSIVITAKVIQITLSSFVGVSDSTKTIEFKVYDKAMVPMNHDLNNKTIILSKNHGWVKVLNFNLFPHLYSFSPFYIDLLQEYALIGLSDPQVGIQNLLWFQVHDFQIGDEIHSEYYNNGVYNGSFSYSTTIKTIEKYLERYDFQDSIVYKVETRRAKELNYYMGDKVQSFTHDTLIKVIKPFPLFDHFPLEPFLEGTELGEISMKNYSRLQKTPLFGLSNESDSCWKEIIFSGCMNNDFYVKGLGGPFYSCYYNFNINEQKLIYYKKGVQTYGSPFIALDAPEHARDKNPELYPNPATEHIWLKATDLTLPLMFDLHDIMGRKVLEQELKAMLSFVHVGSLERGIYFYSFRNENQVIKSGKVILK